jgi:N-acetylmuramoyl-L-alanine amidase
LQRLPFFTAFIAALVTGALLVAQGTPPLLVSRDGRRPVPTTVVSGQELIALDDVANLFQVTVREDALARGVTVAYKGRTIVLSSEQPMASVNGQIVALPAPAVHAGRRWLVPVEFLSRALAPIYDSKIELRRPSRLLIVGDLRVPRVVARIDSPGPPTRITVESTPAATVTVAQEGPRLMARVDADAIDPALPATGSGLVDQIRAGDQPATIVVQLRGGAGTPRTTIASFDGGTRATIEVPAAGAPESVPAPPPPPAPSKDPLPPFAASRAVLQTIVIDPGHGGDDNGVKGPNGTLEKQVTLEVGRRARTLIETRLGIRVILTRDEDRRVRLDERAAVANNSKAELFISLHTNASLVPTVSGAEVFALSLDREGEEARRSAEADSVALPVLGGGTRLIDVIRWDMAQAAHVEASTVLATILEEELRTRVPMGPRPLQQAPQRVLVGANMPAALIEMGYLTSAPQEKQLASVEFQTALTQALYEVVLRFRTYLEGRR